jgi:hypothetical protein
MIVGHVLTRRSHSVTCVSANPENGVQLSVDGFVSEIIGCLFWTT